MRASPGAEKSHSALHPEKPWFLVIGRGFNSRHLHHFRGGHVTLFAVRTCKRASRSRDALFAYAVCCVRLSSGLLGSAGRGLGRHLLLDGSHVEVLDLLDDVLQRGLRQRAGLREDEDLKAIRVGIEVMFAADARDCSASVSTLPKTMPSLSPLCEAAS